MSEEIRAKDIVPHKTSFSAGDGFYGDGNTSFFMEAEALLKLTAQNALAGNVAPAFDPNSTTTEAGLPYMYNGLLYVAKVDGYQGPWDASKFELVNILDFLSSLNSKVENPYSATITIPQARNDNFSIGSGSGAMYNQATRTLSVPIGSQLAGNSYLYTYFWNVANILQVGGSYRLAYVVKSNIFGTLNIYFNSSHTTQTNREIVKLSYDTYLVLIDFTYVSEGEFYVIAGFSSGTSTEVMTYQILASCIFAKNANKRVLDIMGDFGNDFDSSQRYAVGELCLHNNKLYRCTVNHNGAWNASHFTEVKMAGEVGLLNIDSINTKESFETPYFSTIPIPQITDDNFVSGAASGASFDIATRTLSVSQGGNLSGSSYLYTYFGNKANIMEVGGRYRVAYLIKTNLYGAYNLYFRPDSRATETARKTLKLSDDVYLVVIDFTLIAEGNFNIMIQYSSGTLAVAGYYQILKSVVLCEKANEKILDILNDTKTETVLQVGTGKTYTSLRTALEYAATIASAQNHVLVEFYGGGTPYEIRNDITDDDLANSSFIGLIVPDYVKIKGMGGDYSVNTIQLTLESDIDTETRRRISTLNTYQASELENLTIVGTRTRYAVHDDYANAYNVERTMRNLRVVAVDTVNSRSWGAGYRSGCTWNFDNCIFENQGDDSSYSFSAHNTPGENCKDPAILNFFNCRFITPSSEIPNYDRGAAFGSMSNNANGVINYLNFYGCDIERITMYEENAAVYGVGILTRLRGFGNSIPKQIGTYDGTTIKIIKSDGFDYSSYVSVL